MRPQKGTNACDEAESLSAWGVGKAPLQGKWVDVNHGDFEKPVPPTPPMEALRLLLSHVASGRSSRSGGRTILVVDARKAHLQASAERNLYVALPPEVRVPGLRARLSRSLYKLFWGDDFVFAGVETDLESALRQMEQSFLVKVIGRVGADKQDVRTRLGPVLKGDGIQLEADPRHQEIVISVLEQDVSGLSTPGVKNQQKKDGLGDGDETPLDEAEAPGCIWRSTSGSAAMSGLQPHQPSELDAKGFDDKPCRSRTVWDRQGHHCVA